MAKVRADRAVPVDLPEFWPPVPRRLVDRSVYGLLCRPGKAFDEVVHHFAHNLAGRVFCFGRDHILERNKCRDEMDIGIDRLQHLRLKQHLPQVQPIKSILLHDTNDR